MGIRQHCSFLIVFAAVIGFSSCSSDNDNPGEIDLTNKNTNEWIYKIMDENYLWYDELPAKSSLDLDQSPKTFFEGLLSDKDGRDWQGEHLYFSYIEQKHETTKAISEVDPTYGFDFIAYGVENTNYYYARVLYVLPNSPAEEAGLRRDDWISGINGSDNNITDYNVLNGGDALTVKIRKPNYGQSGWVDKGSLTLPTARVIANNPLFKDSVYVYGDRKIGYLVYNHFSAQAEGATDGAYDNQMKTLFSKFKSEGVNEFVLDLRFNGGGLVTSARLLSSLLAPSSALGQIFCTLTYNSKKNTKSEMKFDTTVSGSNLNLNRLYVLTGQFTASASEAVINCLRPYMGENNVRIIGGETLGKAVGSNPYGENESYEWILHPITLKIVNSEGKAEYGQVGFTPDVDIYEYSPYTRELHPLGDTKEILLSTAIGEITGDQSRSLRSDIQTDGLRLKPVYSSLENKKTNGLIAPEE